MLNRRPSRIRISFLLGATTAATIPFAAWSADLILPYTQRTRGYSGYNSTIRGDNENIGMAGATVAIPESVSSVEGNPAGTTMTMGNVTAQINSNTMTDRTITGSSTRKIKSRQWGLTLTPGNWGYAISYYTPSFEAGEYESPNTNQTRDYEVSLKQIRLSVSRSLMKKKLSVGASLEMNRVLRQLGPDDYNATGYSYKLGAIYHLRKHFLLGASFSPAQQFGDSLATSGGPELPGFAQPIRVPAILNLGMGWIPNRFFSIGFSVVGVGATDDTALLRDQNVTVGNHWTWQPRAGASYIIGQYKNLKINAAVGSYYEASRMENTAGRLHGTFSVQVNPYFVNTGAGIDRAERYNNLFVSVGVDIVRAMRTFGFIPKDPVPPLNGFFPKPLKMQADGLPPFLTVGEKKAHSGVSVGDAAQIIEELPQNIENKIEGRPATHEVREEKKERQKEKQRRRSRRKKKPANPPRAGEAPADLRTKRPE